MFGRGKKRSQSVEQKEVVQNFKRKSKPPVLSDRPVPELDMTEVKDVNFTPEGKMINTGLLFLITIFFESS